MNKKVIRIIISITIIIITLMSNKTFAAEKLLLGDINKDNKITSRDFLLLINHVAATTTKKHKEWILTDEQLKVADITGDGKVDSRDYLAILKYVIADNNKEIAKKYPEWKKYIEERQENPIVTPTPTPEPEPTPEVVKVSKISLNETEIKLEIEKAVQLKATIEPENATNKEIKWTSSNEEIATVDNNGIVTAKKKGTAIITVTSQSNKEKTATCTVTVEPKQEPIPTPAPTPEPEPEPTPQIVDVTEIKLDPKEGKILKGKSVKLKVTILPSNATDKTVTWLSNNNAIATVKEGKVTGMSNGTATITAKAGEKIATYKLTVTDKISMSEVKIGKISPRYTTGLTAVTPVVKVTYSGKTLKKAKTIQLHIEII